MEEKKSGCMILGTFGYIVQGVLGILSFLVLIGMIIKINE